MQEVTVDAPDAFRARAIIERQYGRIISGPQQVFDHASPSGGNDSSGNLAWFILLVIVMAVFAGMKYWPF
jgi:hypothetical protein